MINNERRDRVEAAKLFISKLTENELAEFIVCQEDAINGLTKNNRKFAEAFRGHVKATPPPADSDG